MNIIHQGKIINDKIFFNDRKKFDNYTKKLAKGKNIGVEIIVRKPKKETSMKQIRYYYAVPVKIGAREQGLTFQEMDAQYRGRFLNQNVKSLFDMEPFEMNEFIENIIRGEAENNVIIPYPNEVSTD